MATYSRPLRLLIRQSQYRIGTRCTPRPYGRIRWFTVSQPWLEEPDSSKLHDSDHLEAELRDLRDNFRNGLVSVKAGKADESGQKKEKGNASKQDLGFEVPRQPPQKAGLLNMGEKLETDPSEDPELGDDDVTSLAHGDLEQHREYRHYARLTAWEMPLLTKMAKPFVPPTEKEILRFRYTTYMGDEHPAEKKVVVEFCAEDIPDLTQTQQHKLKKLVGSRWNPRTNIIKISGEMFPNQAQNKRYLSDLVDTLLQEARDPVDTFEDIPLDTRHRPLKVKPKFPVEWRMTEERKAELEAHRQQVADVEAGRALAGAIVDGVKRIEGALSPSRGSLREPEMAIVRNVGRKQARRGF